MDIVEADVLGHRMQVFAERHRSLRELLDTSLAHGDQDYLVDGDRRMTYAEHHAAVGRVAAMLRDRGIGKGDRVAILGRNCPEWVVAFWATVSLGAVVAAVNAWWAPDEVAHAIDLTQPTVLLDDLDALRPVVDADDRVAIPEVDVDEDDPAVIVFTSGTTGRAKGATHSHRNVVGLVQAQQAVALSRLPPGFVPQPARILTTTPLFHVSGLHSGVVACLGAGATTIWQPGRFDPLATLQLIEREQVTRWTAVPTTVWRVVHHPAAADHDLSTLRHVGGGGAAWSAALQERMRAVFGEQVTYGIGYGLTESTGLATSASYQELLADPDTVGRPAPTVQVDVVDGEIRIRGPLVMLGYWADEAATRAVIDDERWLHTGDLGELRDGMLYLTTRRTDLVIRGGENVYPVEVENALESHPGVAEVAVVGIPDDELGQVVAAVVVPAPGAALDADALARHVRARLAGFKVPSRWVVTDHPLPRNAVGKLLRADVLDSLGVSP